MKWVIFSILILSFKAWGLQNPPQDSSKEFYNQAVLLLEKNQKTKAISSFRKAVMSDSWNRSSWKALKQLKSPLSFWWLIPYEIFLSLILLGVIFLVFSFRIWKGVFLLASIILTSSFWYYRSIPRWTVLKQTPLLSAPVEESPSIITLKKSSFVTQIGAHGKEWVQIKISGRSGWLKRSSLY